MARRLHRAIILTGISALVFSGTLFGQAPRKPYQLPAMNFAKDAKGYYVNVSDEAYLRYMWESFVALNWPAKAGTRGEPDTAAKALASRHPVVWESLAKPQEVFLPETQWANYPAWNELPRLPAGLSLIQAQTLCQGFSVANDIILYENRSTTWPYWIPKAVRACGPHSTRVPATTPRGTSGRPMAIVDSVAPCLP